MEANGSKAALILILGRLIYLYFPLRTKNLKKVNPTWKKTPRKVMRFFKAFLLNVCFLKSSFVYICNILIVVKFISVCNSCPERLEVLFLSQSLNFPVKKPIQLSILEILFWFWQKYITFLYNLACERKRVITLCLLKKTPKQNCDKICLDQFCQLIFCFPITALHRQNSSSPCAVS